MLQGIEYIRYRIGLLEKGMLKSDFPLKTIKNPKPFSELMNVFHENDILNLGGIYGNPEDGDPVQYDQIIIKLTYDSVEIEFYNRAIALVTSDDERYKRLHRFMCKLQETKN